MRIFLCMGLFVEVFILCNVVLNAKNLFMESLHTIKNNILHLTIDKLTFLCQ